MEDETVIVHDAKLSPAFTSQRSAIFNNTMQTRLFLLTVASLIIVPRLAADERPVW